MVIHSLRRDETYENMNQFSTQADRLYFLRCVCLSLSEIMLAGNYKHSTDHFWKTVWPPQQRSMIPECISDRFRGITPYCGIHAAQITIEHDQPYFDTWPHVQPVSPQLAADLAQTSRQKVTLNRYKTMTRTNNQANIKINDANKQ